jgi:hypothetical protein
MPTLNGRMCHTARYLTKPEAGGSQTKNKGRATRPFTFAAGTDCAPGKYSKAPTARGR